MYNAPAGRRRARMCAGVTAASMTSILRLLDGKRAKIVEQNDLEIVHVHETVRKL